MKKDRSRRIATTSACLVLLAGQAKGQNVSSQPRQNPNVPAITGDRQPIPKPRGDGPETSSTRGSATGLITMEQRPQLREFALKHRGKELKTQADFRVGSVLPAAATLLDIPPEFNLARYRLSLANQKTFLVDPVTRRIEEVID
jgi:hypothetical protein